jgi:thiol-disulfide isomerase/thioredoxin
MSSDFSQFNTALIWAYNALLCCIPLFVILGVVQMALAIAFWRSERRFKRLKRAGVLFTAAALMPFLLFGLWRGVIGPSLGAESTAKYNLSREKQLTETSILRVGSNASAIDKLLAEAGVPLDAPKIVVLNFFATWCGPCLAEMPHLQQIADKYVNHKEILFLVVGREESQERLDAFASKNGYRLPFIADPERRLYSQFARESIPRTYLIDREREIRFEIVGYDQQKLDELDAQISELADVWIK